MTWWSQVTWDVARAGGFAAYGLLSLSVLWGLFLSLGWQKPSFWPRLVNDQLHQHLTALALVFTTIHVLAVALDPFTAFRWYEVLIPALSHYRPLWMALGIVAAYLGLAVGITSILRGRIPYRTWRMVHFLTFLTYALATVHGLGTGSDTRTAWATAIYVASTGSVAFLVVLRLFRSKAAPVVQWAGVFALAGVVGWGSAWAQSGPLKAGWNTIANNGRGSGSPSLVRNTSATQSGFRADLAGSVGEQGGEDGLVILDIETRLSGGAAGRLRIEIAGAATDGGVAITRSAVALEEASPYAGVYQGTVQSVNSGDMIATLTPEGGGSALRLDIGLQFGGSGQVTGSVQATPIP